MKSGNSRLVAIIAVAVIAGIVKIWSIGLPRNVQSAGLMLNAVRSAKNPPGTLTVEVGPSGTAKVDTSSAQFNEYDASTAGEWPSYNRTLQSRRYSPLDQINTGNVGRLKELCRYDTGLHESFESGPLMVHGALIFTTALDVFSIDPSTCRENWRTRETYRFKSFLVANRGAAYLNGRVYRGTLDGRVVAYDFKTGKQVWSTRIADQDTGEIVASAPIAWDGLIYIGVSLGDLKGVKGRVYALDAASGEITWEEYLVPKEAKDPQRGPQAALPARLDTWGNRTEPELPISGGGSWTSFTLDPGHRRLYIPVGNPSPDVAPGLRTGTNLYTNSVLTVDAKTGAYINHFQIAPVDWHDWDVSNTPTLVTTRGGKQIIAFTPKNGFLYSYDVLGNRLLYKTPVTRFENAAAPFSTEHATHFCPGSYGGGEWNGTAYDPRTNLLLSGDTEWCTSIIVLKENQIRETKLGDSWLGGVITNPVQQQTGQQDSHELWRGWIYATDADTGEWVWRARSNYPALSGITPTAGGLIFFGDMGGNLYALDATNGHPLWKQNLTGAIGGGVITYSASGQQRVAVAAGLTSPLWPTKIDTAKVVIYGLRDAGFPDQVGTALINLQRRL
jgi:alcohol dehydrogenase (cytochrome c)